MTGETTSGMLLTRKRVSMFDGTLKVSWIGIWKALGKAIGAKNVGNLAANLGELREAVSDSPGHLGWLLIRRALVRALCELVHSLREEIGAVDQAALNEAEAALELDALVGAIDAAFLTSPARLDLLRELHAPLVAWLQANGVAPQEAQGVANRLRTHFVCGLHDEWASEPKFYEPLLKTLQTPFSGALLREQAFWRYAKMLRGRVNEPMMAERFGLQSVYVPLRAYWERGDGGPADERSGQSERVVVDLRAALDGWLGQRDRRDMLRVLSGGPGSGKSSFTRMYAAEVAERGEMRVLRVALHHLDHRGDLRKELQRFAEQRLSFNPLQPAAGAVPEPLLLILDGLDELAMQGKAATEAACAFAAHVQKVLTEENAVEPWLYVVLSGRELVVQASEAELREPHQILHLVPYSVQDNRLPQAGVVWEDPESLLAEDQRPRFWVGYLSALGRTTEAVPDAFGRGELDEVTRQPLLMYLVAYSYLQGELDPNSANVNSVYETLIKTVWQRDYDGKRPLPNIKSMGLAVFERLLQGIAVATWHGNGRSAAVAEVAPCLSEKLRARLRDFQEHAEQENAEHRMADLLTAFYFRQTRHARDEATFEFTHKSFAEYLIARRIMAELEFLAAELGDEEEETGRRRFTAADCLKLWVELCGAAAMTPYIFRFLRREIERKTTEQARAIQRSMATLISVVVASGSPLQLLSPRLDFGVELRWARNAEEALLAVAALCSDVTREITDVSWPKGSTAASVWLRRLHGQSTHVDAEFWGDFLRHQEGLWAGESSSLTLGSLRRLNLAGQSLRRLDLHRADLQHAELSRADLRGADLEGGNLVGTRLQDAKLDGARLTRACLREAVLPQASLAGVELFGANLVGADLTGANLTNADLTSTHLADAKLDGATLADAKCVGTDFTGVSSQALASAAADVGRAYVTPWPKLPSLPCSPASAAPSWAVAAGQDGAGRWAEIEVAGVRLRLRRIESGRFMMGSPETEEGRWGNEGLQHEVHLSQSFYLAEVPCPQAFWKAVMDDNPSYFKGAERPVECVSWHDCQRFFARLNERVPGLEARLPTEAEWEYACRAGTSESRFGSLDEVAWYADNGGWETHTVGLKRPNAWGLHDMLGNVFEWCEDWYGDYGHQTETDPSGPEVGSRRVLRGGSWYLSARGVRVADRLNYSPESRLNLIGFRLARGTGAP